MKRFAAPAIGTVATLAAIASMLFLEVESIVVLLIAAGGAPVTALLVISAVADPDRSVRRLWPSFLLGAVMVPPLVLLLHGSFLALGVVLIEPFTVASRELLDELRADPTLVDLLTSGWTYVYIVEAAVVAPLVEETLKPIGALVRRLDGGRAAFLFGAAAGAGFAVVENLVYASGWFWSPSSYWLPVSLARMMGAGIHVFGTGLVAWGVHRVRTRSERRWRDLGWAFVTAATIHGVWNGTIAVTEVLYAGRSEISTALSNDAAAWGVTLLVLLAIVGALVLGALLLAGRNVRDDRSPLQPGMLAGLEEPRGVAAWAMIATTLLIPATILVLVFPSMIAV